MGAFFVFSLFAVTQWGAVQAGIGEPDEFAQLRGWPSWHSPKNSTKSPKSSRNWKSSKYSSSNLRVRTKPRLAAAARQVGRRVVVVGAGYAGWGAAQRLVEGGLRPADVTVVEADGDHGGRTRRNEGFMPFPLDLGASYIHWSFMEELADLAGVRADDLPLAQSSHYGWYLWRDPATYYGFLTDHIVSTLVDICESSSECREQAERLGIDKFSSGDYSDIDAYGCFSKNDRAYWGRGGTDEQRKGGLGGIKQRIHCGGVNTQYRCQVTSVDYRQANNVVTRCEDGRSFVSNQVIVTVPLSVLKDGDIDFRPALPQPIQRNVDRRGWGRGFKVFIEFDTSFRPYDWVCFPSDDDCYVYDDDDILVGEQLFWDHVTPSAPGYEGRRTLVAGYVTGSLAEDFSGMSESRVVEKILEDLADYYYWGGRYHRGYRPGIYRRHLLVDWSDPDVKPFVRGTYSSPWPGYEGHRADDRDRIFLAGEAFAAPLDDEDGEYEDPGWVYTAMHSGQKAAELILDLPPPPPATPKPSPRPTPRPKTPGPSPRPTPRPTPPSLPTRNCANDMSWGFTNKRRNRKDCIWVSKKPNSRRCGKRGDDGRKAKEACPKACETACKSASNDGIGLGLN